MRPTLVILAAGMGSRYGGLKQIDPVGPNGEVIIEYSIYDAIRAGFGKVVFVIRKSFEPAFKERFSNKFDDKIEIAYAFQEINPVVPGVEDIPERTKPWGTAHAVLAAKDVVNEPFAVINADDYYGVNAFQQIADFLTQKTSERLYAMVGYILQNTISEHGSVNRGICEIDENNHLTDVVERHKIQRIDGEVSYLHDDDKRYPLDENGICSMNYWGFHPSFMVEVEAQFIEFVKHNKSNPKSEFYIPFVVNNMIKAGRLDLEVLTSADQWYGVTYKDDKENVVNAFNKLTSDGVYPDSLWG